MCDMQSLCSNKRVTYSRGYVNFNEAKGALEFKSKFDGFVFVGARGTQYKCLIEYAPYQRVPKQKGRQDRRQGTIEQGHTFNVRFEMRLNVWRCRSGFSGICGEFG